MATMLEEAERLRRFRQGLVVNMVKMSLQRRLNDDAREGPERLSGWSNL